ncbi:tRNA glutamyl-Q(34) synthetase GluQRS [Xylophilus ampelinus]|uniref:Glutamyl-Q tRNA(Asp) synthetase n=1 Tax=Xylophilus ampelinus TaxID=54067 RepID=A0A318SQA3_9BURK|nr:tRNA glutamyl-Q(34) synthetase GluQRS [Xylophilus ampelinus]MCS4508701.1 tRNA glutamyl-Q(34) synthetase GluQRS [Xylophilus ampelinus]PYE74285.1 glutamyl-Q tRNA(Asp) synthetase [Xylophilus ampelinus]
MIPQGDTGAGAAGYVGRFAPSPTGPLHAGSLVAALASWLDARAHGGRWLVRIEDVDAHRCISGADRTILSQLAACALVPDAPPLRQSARTDLYATALAQLVAGGAAYPCGCSRRDIEEAQAVFGVQRQRHAALPYPGSCRTGLHGKPARAWRFRTDISTRKVPVAGEDRRPRAIRLIANPYAHLAMPPVRWTDRAYGPQSQAVEDTVGDFVLLRADGLYAYQLAVVVDDAAQGITDIVRGADLLDNTPRQLLLQRALGLAAPRYLHTPLVLAASGDKLSKHNGAEAFDAARPAEALSAAAAALGLPAAAPSDTVADRLARWVPAWRARWGMQPGVFGAAPKIDG